MLRTVLLLSLLTSILLAVGWFFAGFTGLTSALILAFLLNFLIYWYSDRIVLAMYSTKEITRKDEPKLHGIIEKLSEEAKIPKPKVYVVKTKNPNAFATGRSVKHATVAITSGLLESLEWDEIEGVVSHEIGHIKARDTLTSVVAATLAGAISYIAQIALYSSFGRREERGNALLLPLIFLAPIAATLVQLAISRTREYRADHSGAIFSKKPLSLASGLEKISGLVKVYPMRGNTATSHLFIVNPFKEDVISNLFMTHPPVQERVKRLKELAKSL